MSLLEEHLSRLRGKTAWITGGKRIGQVVARSLSEQGVHLVLSYLHSAAEAVETAGQAKKRGISAVAVRADVASRESFEAAAESVRAEFPTIDILVNMASVYLPVSVDAITERDWELNFGAHVLGTYWPVRVLAPRMPPGAHIINVADVTSEGKPQRRSLPYIATKGAVAAMTRAMALEYGPRGIFVNAIAPGPILPPDDFPRDVWKRIRERSPVKVTVTDQEAEEQFAILVLYLSLTTMSSGHLYPLDQGQNLY